MIDNAPPQTLPLERAYARDTLNRMWHKMAKRRGAIRLHDRPPLVRYGAEPSGAFRLLNAAQQIAGAASLADNAAS